MKTIFSVRAGIVTAALVLIQPAATVDAASVVFADDPFAGTTVLETPGRQFVGNELFVPDFDFSTDTFEFRRNAFGVDSLSFQTSLVADLPTSGVNVVVVQDTDNDNDPATPFLAGTAANLIADQIDAPTPGFFIYHNSNLGLNRLVFSTDLSDASSDLKILARMTSPSGSDAIDLLPNISAANFSVVPEPSTCLLTALGGSVFLFGRRRTWPAWRLFGA